MSVVECIAPVVCGIIVLAVLIGFIDAQREWRNMKGGEQDDEMVRH